MKKVFEKYGNIIKIKVSDSKDTIAYVEFENIDQANQAYEKYIINYLNNLFLINIYS